MPPTDPQPQMVADRYRLEREIGRGGMGAVWLGHDELLGRRVALKRVGVHPGAHEADLERVRREARVSAMLNHEHVVAVYDLVGHAGQHWLVMEYVESQNLAAYIKQRDSLDPDETARLIRQATVALAAAHGAGIIHRDVKPSNLLVTDQGQVKLTDFGIARTGADSSLTQTGMVTGSPGYLAPEVASGRPATAASDMWSLGATIFHAVTGKPPYDASDNLIGTLYQIVHEEPVRTDRAGWLDPLLRATMHREPEGRWTARQVTDYLTQGPSAASSFTAVVPSVGVASTAERMPAAAPMPGEATEVMPVTQTEVQPVPEAAPLAGGGAIPPSVPAGAAPVASSPDSPVGAPPAGTPPTGSSGTSGSGASGSGRDGSRSQSGGRGRLLPILVGLLVAAIVIMGVVAWQLVNGSDDSGTDQAQDSTSQSAPTPSESESKKPEKKDKPTKVEMTDFVSNYVNTAAGDPAAGFAQLTPTFQQQSNGLEGYRGWWGQFSDATASKIKANTKTMTVSYDVDYVYKDGSTLNDSVSLRLEYADGIYKIAGEG